MRTDLQIGKFTIHHEAVEDKFDLMLRWWQVLPLEIVTVFRGDIGIAVVFQRKSLTIKVESSAGARMPFAKVEAIVTCFREVAQINLVVVRRV